MNADPEQLLVEDDAEIGFSHKPRQKPSCKARQNFQKKCTYFHHGLVASAATLNFRLQILVLLVTMREKLPIIHFCLAPLEYDDRNKKYIDNTDVRW